MRLATQRRRVLVITYEFPPGMEMGAQACAQIARYLPLYGWEPVVLTVRERYIENISDRPQRAFPGLVIRTHMVPHPLSVFRSLKSRLRLKADEKPSEEASFEKMGVLKRWVLSLLRVVDMRTGWILPASVAGLGVIRQQKVSHLFSSGPPWTSHLVGLVVARLTGLPWTVHFRDPWTGIPQWKPVSALSARIETTLEKMVVSRATSVVCVTDRHTNMMRQIYLELPPDKFVTVPNGFDEAEWNDVEVGNDGGGLGREDKFVITYAGQLYWERSPLPLFRALRALADAGGIELARVRVDLVGWCDVARGRRVTEMAADCGIGDCINVKGPLSRTETVRKLARSDLLLLLAEGLTLQIPGKTYEYLRARRPILALTSEGALAELLRETGGAWVVDPADDNGIVAAVREAYRVWNDGLLLPTANPALVSGFDRRLLAGRFADLFDRGISGLYS